MQFFRFWTASKWDDNKCYHSQPSLNPMKKFKSVLNQVWEVNTRGEDKHPHHAPSQTPFNTKSCYKGQNIAKRKISMVIKKLLIIFVTDIKVFCKENWNEILVKLLIIQQIFISYLVVCLSYLVAWVCAWAAWVSAWAGCLPTSPACLSTFLCQDKLSTTSIFLRLTLQISG